jgi:hypothetical protein
MVYKKHFLITLFFLLFVTNLVAGNFGSKLKDDEPKVFLELSGYKMTSLEDDSSHILVYVGSRLEYIVDHGSTVIRCSLNVEKGHVLLLTSSVKDAKVWKLQKLDGYKNLDPLLCLKRGETYILKKKCAGSISQKIYEYWGKHYKLQVVFPHQGIAYFTSVEVPQS